MKTKIERLEQENNMLYYIIRTQKKILDDYHNLVKDIWGNKK